MKQPIVYPDVPLPDGQLYTDYEGWLAYGRAVNKAAGEQLAGWGTACPCNGKAMEIGYGESYFTCSSCGDTVSRATVIAALGLPDVYHRVVGMDATVG